MSSRFLIGTAGIPHSTQPYDGEDLTSAGIRKIRELGLDSMEIEFVKGIYLKNDEQGNSVKAYAEKFGVILTAHAPYYINLGNPEKLVSSEQMILKTLNVASKVGIKSIAFHPAYYKGEDPEVIFQRVKKSLSKILFVARKRGYNVEIRPETAGRTYQFGSLDEIIRLVKEVKGLKPCIDFAHIYSRSRGEINGYDGFMKVLEKIHSELGDWALKDMHCHVEGIEFDENGEKRHLNFSESGFDVKGLAKALKESGASGIIICESPSLEHDALYLKEILS
jgi:deoxyribonuclease-4